MLSLRQSLTYIDQIRGDTGQGSTGRMEDRVVWQSFVAERRGST